jgi:hypothetical protein
MPTIRQHLPAVLRYLRIAFSVLCVSLCVLVIIMWVRSRENLESIGWSLAGGQGFMINSAAGTLSFSAWHAPNPPIQIGFGFSGEHLDAQLMALLEQRIEETTFFGFSHRWDARTLGVGFPDWFLFLVLFGLAALPWIKWRFSLRTLFIAMTLVAVLLGAIVISMR